VFHLAQGEKGRGIGVAEVRIMVTVHLLVRVMITHSTTTRLLSECTLGTSLLHVSKQVLPTLISVIVLPDSVQTHQDLLQC